MVQAYLEVLKSWKDVRGRMRRDKFWEAFTCNVFIVILLVMFTMRLGGVFEYIQMIYQIVTTVPFVTGAIRRLHDIGKTGWFMLLAFIPFIGWVALAMMLCTASNPEANRFGENPYEEGYYHL